MKLAGLTAAISVPLALALGITSAMWRGTLYDRIVTVATIGIVSVPEFMIATLAVLLFAVYLKWLPALSFTSEVKSFSDLVRAYAMPVVTLTFGVSAQMIRMSRAAVVETLNADERKQLLVLLEKVQIRLSEISSQYSKNLFAPQS